MGAGNGRRLLVLPTLPQVQHLARAVLVTAAQDPRIKDDIEVAVRALAHNTPDEILLRKFAEMIYTAGQIAGVQQTLDSYVKVRT